ncbi:MAG: aminotransferase, partial [Microbacteriaceae bacterium]
EIARNPYAPQAFVINRTLGLQFHPEITPEILDVWLDGPGRTQVENFGMNPDIMLAQTGACAADARARANHLVDAFLERVAGLS